MDKKKTTQKKIKDLKSGDSIYYLDKRDLAAGIRKYTLTSDWTVDYRTKEHTASLRHDIGRRCICVPISSFSKPAYSSLYDIWGTSEEELIAVAEKFIRKETERYEKKIQEIQNSLKWYTDRKKTLEKMLKKTETK